MSMNNFWDFSVWGGFHLLAVLLVSLLIANILKRTVKFLRASLIPTSVLGGVILLILAEIYGAVTGDVFFDTEFFGGKGITNLEIITYHTLALGFIAATLKSSGGKLSKKRTAEIFDTGVTTVSTYLLQGILGMAITIPAAMLVSGFFPAAGILLPFGYGQGTGQALNFGVIFETEHGFIGGRSFGLTIAALGFLSASMGGVVHLNLLKKRGKIYGKAAEENAVQMAEIQGENEIPMQGSMDKTTVQVAFVSLAYLLSYVFMWILGMLLPGMKSVIYGFNFILGVLAATLVKAVVNKLTDRKIIKRKYINDFLMTRISNFFYDIMVVAGIAAIRLGILEDYWGIILIMGVTGLVASYFYNYYIAKTLFPEYVEEQFLMMYGMLTGTASTGIILLREIDGSFRTPAADNMVYQNFPAIVFGFPLMLLANLAPLRPVLTLGILAVFFGVMNLILFRRQIFRKKTK